MCLRVSALSGSLFLLLSILASPRLIVALSMTTTLPSGQTRGHVYFLCLVFFIYFVKSLKLWFSSRLAF